MIAVIIKYYLINCFNKIVIQIFDLQLLNSCWLLTNNTITVEMQNNYLLVEERE